MLVLLFQAYLVTYLWHGMFQSSLESRIIVHARNMYFDEISTMHGLIRDMHEPKFSTFELFWGIFAMFCPFCHVFL